MLIPALTYCIIISNNIDLLLACLYLLAEVDAVFLPDGSLNRQDPKKKWSKPIQID